MPLRPEDLSRDPAALAEMALALQGENDALRAENAMLKTLIFGARSERAAVIGAEQLAFGLGQEASASPAAANDDNVARPADKARAKARRNIGALPAHLPRCEQVIEPSSNSVPLLRDTDAPDRGRCRRSAGPGTGAVARFADDPSQICVPRL